MTQIFFDDFSVKSTNLPGNWRVEKNSDMQTYACEIKDETFSLLSPGDKFLPIIDPVKNAQVSFQLRIENQFSVIYEFLISFRYDSLRRRGECIRIIANKHQNMRKIQYGENIDNYFVLHEELDCTVADDEFYDFLPANLTFQEDDMSLNLADKDFSFKSRNKDQAGLIAISRGAMLCTADIKNFKILADKAPELISEKKFRVALPQQPVVQAFYCDLNFKEFAEYYELELSLDGGVKYTEAGEGNYRTMRTDLIKKPYLKLISEKTKKHYNLLNDTIVSVPEIMAPEYFYGVLNRKIELPFRKKVRFSKKQNIKFFAIGAEEFYNTILGSQKLAPAETIFDLEGRTLYSGKGICDKQVVISFKSQADKKIKKLLPKDDPRLEKAEQFAERNHYFLQDEQINFSVKLNSLAILPVSLEFILEDVFFNPLEKLIDRSQESISANIFPALKTRQYNFCLPALSAGVYHLRCRSLDPCFPELEDYCAFEVIDPAPDALPPPMISGLPFLYNNRSETRGLDTDSFDPWHGESVDDGHYISCATFMPQWARDYKIYPTTKAYKRQNFLWLGTRNSDNPSVTDNKALIAECDYLNCHEELNDVMIIWRSRYQGEFLKLVIQFAKENGDDNFNIPALEKAYAEKAYIDLENMKVLLEKYYVSWTNFFQQNAPKDFLDFFQENVLLINPQVKLCCYGPSAIYASHYKGVEHTRSRILYPDKKYAGFLQMEDYPRACRYGIERGTFYLMSCLLGHPGVKIYPEVYTGASIQGSTDGAVNFAHPPYGVRPRTPGLFVKRRMLDYALAGAVFDENGFRYWQDQGYQGREFWRDTFEGMLAAYKIIRSQEPLKPLQSTAFCWSEDSWQAVDSGQTILHNYYDGILDLRTSKTESVPYFYEEARKNQLQGGFLADLSAISKLGKDDIHTLVLPPLKGVPEAILQEIRRLHNDGVNLICSENLAELAELFGVKDTGTFTAVSEIRGTENFLPEQKEYCSEKSCVGSYEVSDAKVLLQAEIPVLTIKENNGAYAVFYNVPPTFVHYDRHYRLGYGRNSISELIDQATGLILRKLDRSSVKTSEGMLTAYKAKNNNKVILIGNSSEEESILPELSVERKTEFGELLSVSVPYKILTENENKLELRLVIEKEETAVIIFA